MLTSVRGLLAATVLAGSMLAVTPALADETEAPAEFTFSGNAALVTDYRFRGISLSAGDAAIQGTINVNHASGFYAGVWGSSLEDSAVYGHTELDVYAGWTGEVAPGLTADVGLLYYVYPNGKVGDANVFEPYGSLKTTFGPATAKVGFAYAWEQDSLGGDDNLYLYTSVDVAVPETPLTVSGKVGYTDGALSPNLLTLKSGKAGFDYSLGVSAALTSKLTLGVTYTGVEGNSIKDFSDDSILGSLTLSF